MLDQLKYAPDQAAIVAITDRRGRITCVNDKFCGVDTTIVPLLGDLGAARQYLAIRYDVTQRKAAELQLREQQAALAKLGELAAIVAHEVRNPLGGVRGPLQILETRIPPDTPGRQIVGAMIERIDALADRVKDILLFAFAQGQTMQVDGAVFGHDPVRVASCRHHGGARLQGGDDARHRPSLQGPFPGRLGCACWSGRAGPGVVPLTS